jgi:hypothetical protein
MEKILFVLKDRLYNYSNKVNSYGLINSSLLLAEFLNHRGHECKVVTVVDANGIDKEVHEFKPDVVVIEALWVPTYKLKELLAIKRYHHIKWIVRVHSDIGFLSTETQGLKHLNDYIGLHAHNLTISLNSRKFVDALSDALDYKFTYLPNVVNLIRNKLDNRGERQHIDIGCFGATRLLKNQCFQAICAIKAADVLGKKLLFHVTPNLEQTNDPVLENLKQLFQSNKHDLIIHDWMPNNEFQELIKHMDIGMQVSYTESFNIVAADFINNNRLVLVSDAIDWLPNIMRTSTTDYDEAVKKILYMYKYRNSYWLKEMSRYKLEEYNKGAKHEWEEFLHKLDHHK